MDIPFHVKLKLLIETKKHFLHSQNKIMTMVDTISLTSHSWDKALIMLIVNTIYQDNQQMLSMQYNIKVSKRNLEYCSIGHISQNGCKECHEFQAKTKTTLACNSFPCIIFIFFFLKKRITCLCIQGPILV